MDKKIVYIVVGLLLAINIYAKGLKKENGYYSTLENSVISKTTEIFNYGNQISTVKAISEKNLTDVSEQNVNFVINKMR